MDNKQKALVKILSAIFILLFVISCNIDFENGKINISKEEYDYERIIELSNEGDYETFTANIDFGGVELEKGNIFDLKIKIYEKIENDVKVSLKNGKLVGISKADNKFAMGNIAGTIPAKTSLEIDSGTGNVTIKEFNNKFIKVDTGAGNVIIRDCKCKKELDIDTGAGNISIGKVNSDVIELDSGAGNISMTEVNAFEIECNTGVGNISAFNSEAPRVEFYTGIGNISTVDCVFKEKEFSTGLGKIRNSDKN